MKENQKYIDDLLIHLMYLKKLRFGVISMSSVDFIELYWGGDNYKFTYSTIYEYLIEDCFLEDFAEGTFIYEKFQRFNFLHSSDLLIYIKNFRDEFMLFDTYWLKNIANLDFDRNGFPIYKDKNDYLRKNIIDVVNNQNFKKLMAKANILATLLNKDLLKYYYEQNFILGDKYTYSI